MYAHSILDTIGNTPLIRLGSVSSGNVFAKAEFLNPGGSIKDRVGKYIIEKAEETGKLKKGMTIIEATSGNTGIGLALVGVLKGYHVLCVMPENMSEERKKIISALGGEIVFTNAEKSLEGCLEELSRIVADDPEKYFIVNQFSNPLNPEIHYLTTAPEIWEAALS
jgi:cysteine synthase A